jgi:putative flippase GtrA
MSKQFISFVLTGAFAALVNWISRIGFSHYVSLEIAVVLAYLVGMVTAYTLSKFLVFEKSGRNVSDEFIRFTLVNVVALVQVWLITIGMARFLLPALNWNWHVDEIAHAIGVASPVITSYLGHRYFTFKRKNS